MWPELRSALWYVALAGVLWLAYWAVVRLLRWIWARWRQEDC
jgi:hypothetical protein